MGEEWKMSPSMGLRLMFGLTPKMSCPSAQSITAFGQFVELALNDPEEGGFVILLWICAQIASVRPSVGPIRVVSVSTKGMVVHPPEPSETAVKILRLAKVAGPG